jgi:DNA helicase HerA-like ATPase
VLTIKNDKVSLAKALPGFFSELRDVTKEDFSFINSPKRPLYLGELRSGSKVLDVPIALDGKNVLSHHVLIPATTGRGKSNLLKVLLWSIMEEEYCGVLVLDPHYSPDPLPGAHSLLINVQQLRPAHFNGAASWSGPQREALVAYHKRFGKRWIENIILEEEVKNFNEATLAVVRRRIMSLLGLDTDGLQIFENSIFRLTSGENTIGDVTKALENAKTVVVDTSSFSGPVEILIGSVFTTEALNKYKYYKQQGTLKDKPVISVVLEEAPRVIGKEVLEQGPNIFSTVAREGRKFNVGLLAITQLPSLIPRQILANMNTKIVLGLEMRPERQAIIDSAAQDLSSDDRSIASLDKGEAIVTTNFSPFALPIKIPFFDEWIKEQKKEAKNFPGLKK